MARTPGGYEVLDVARKQLAKTACVREIRILLAVILPLENGMSIGETAKVIGRNADWVSRERNAFIRRKGLPEKNSGKKPNRNRALMTLEEEQKFMSQFTEVARQGKVLSTGEIHEALEKHLGKKVALATVYNLLRRSDWRKLESVKRNVVAGSDTQNDIKFHSDVGQDHSTATAHSG